MTSILRKAVAGLCTALLVSLSTQAFADYPERTVRIVVPYPAGGATDTLARQVAQGLSQAWDSPVIVDNRAGASGITGAENVATSTPDGHTLLFSIVALAQLAALHETLPFDVATDFAPLSEVARSQNLLVVPKSLGVESFEEFIERVRSEPGQHAYGSYGAGTSSHIYGEMLKTATASDLVHVPYRGAAPLITDILGEMVALGIVDNGSIRPHMDSDRFNVIAATGAERSPLAPDAPTLGELGYEGFETYGWFGMFAPAGVPEDILDTISEELVRVIGGEEMTSLIDNLGLQQVGSDRASFSQVIQSDLELWNALIAQTGVTID